MRAPTMLRKKGTAHYAAVPVGARIARPRFVQHSLFAQLYGCKNGAVAEVWILQRLNVSLKNA